MSRMVTRQQLEAVAAVFMRVPGLFIIDYWWQHDRDNSLPNTMDIMDILNAVITNLVLLHGLLLLLLPLPHVKALYTHIVSGGLIVCSHVLSKHYLSTESEAHHDFNYYKKQCAVILFHIITASVLDNLIQGQRKPPPFLACYILPVLARFADFSIDTARVFHNFACAIMVYTVTFYIVNKVNSIVEFAKMAYNDILVIADSYGFIAVVTALWNQLFVPNHFAVFWLFEFLAKLLRDIYQQSDTVSWSDKWYIIIMTTVSSICASPISLVATSVTVSYLSFFTLTGTQAYLQGQLSFHADNPMHSGWTEGLTLVLLAIQTGLAEMKMPARMAVMIIILFIVLSCLLQSMLEITEPIVLALSAQRSRNYGRHIRALSLCIALLTFPLYLSYKLSLFFPIDFWLIVVLSSCMLTSVQVIDLLIVHGLFIYDSMKSDTWESLDDVVYYTRAVTKVLEFVMGVFVVGMGLWESATVKWNWVTGSVLMIHCYFNVWQRLKNGWQSFLLRREAVKKSDSLPAASEDQLHELDDVCSICFARMYSACITPCNHFFHRTCLRKWLYVQDKCPLCHSIITTLSR